MERTFHCSYDNLQAICGNQSDDKIKTLTAFDSINVIIKQETQLPTEEEYVLSTKGDIPPKEDSNDRFLSLDNLQRTYNLPKIDRCTDPTNINWDEHPNDVCTLDFFENNPKAMPSGITVLDSPDWDALNNIWIIPTYEGIEFDWTDVFSGGVPISNSAIFIDRYMFKNIAQGAINIKQILQCMVRRTFEGEFRTLIIFDKGQTENQETTLSDAIAQIDSIIRSGLSKKSCSLRIEYLAVWDSTRINGFWSDPVQHSLYNKTHDRIIYTNYYTISATKALNATRKQKDRKIIVATNDQKITYMSILNGVGKKNQRPDFLPIKSDKEMLARFITPLDKISDDKILCFCSTTEKPTPCIIKKTDIKNRILNFARDTSGKQPVMTSTSDYNSLLPPPSSFSSPRP